MNRLNNQTGKGDFTTLHKGKIYKFPTEGEMWEFIREEANVNDSLADTIIVDFKPGNQQGVRT